MADSELKRVVLTVLLVISPFVLCIALVFVFSLYTPNIITGIVQIIEDENTDEPYQIVLCGEGDNILGNKDVWVCRNFDAVDEIICERENITDGDSVVFNRKGIIQYKINE